MTKNEKKIINKKIKAIKWSIALEESEILTAKKFSICFHGIDKKMNNTEGEITNRHLIIEELKKELKELEDYKGEIND